MSRQHKEHSPTMYELACMVAVKQAGGELVDIPTIRLRISRAGLEAETTTIGAIMKRMEARNFIFRIDQNYRPRGEPFVFYSFTDAGRTWTECWQSKMKELI